jgi:hypothetical protein
MRDAICDLLLLMRLVRPACRGLVGGGRGLLVCRARVLSSPVVRAQLGLFPVPCAGAGAGAWGTFVFEVGRLVYCLAAISY